MVVVRRPLPIRSADLVHRGRERFVLQVAVAFRRARVFVAQQLTDNEQVNVRIDYFAGRAVPQIVQVDVIEPTGPASPCAEPVVNDRKMYGKLVAGPRIFFDKVTRIGF